MQQDEALYVVVFLDDPRINGARGRFQVHRGGHGVDVRTPGIDFGHQFRETRIPRRHDLARRVDVRHLPHQTPRRSQEESGKSYLETTFSVSISAIRKMEPSNLTEGTTRVNEIAA